MRRIGRYEVTAELGRGGAGVVYRATDAEGFAVAVKLLLDPRGAERLARFERERRLLAALGEAEGFVPLLDAGTSDQGPFIVMPFLPGGTLRERMDQGPLSVPDALAIGAALAAAMGRAHANGIVHRDLKPENVLYTHRGADQGSWGRPLISDLGLAKHFRDDTPGASQSVALTKDFEARGTFAYMAPEQATNAKDVGPPADVFALGVILYECLAGEHPFRADSAFSMAALIQMANPPSLRGGRRWIPRAVAAVVHRALAKDPAARFADANALRAALEEAEKAPSAAPVHLAAALGVAGLVAAAIAFSQLRPNVAAVTAPPPAPAPSPPPPPPPPRPLPSPPPESLPFVRVDEPPLASNTQKERQLIRKAAALLAKHDYDGAIDAATKAIAMNPIAGYYKTRALGHGGKGATALEHADLTSALALEPDDVPLLELRLESGLKLGRFAEALADADRALKADTSVHLLAGRAAARAALDDPKGALEDYGRALERDPSNLGLLRSRAEVRVKVGDKKGAVEDLERARKLVTEKSAEAREIEAMIIELAR
ncbi:MAG: protein kinase [Planctomycetota bacterium]